MNTIALKQFSKDILHIENIESVSDTIVQKLRNDVAYQLQRKGGVVGISGGIDSSVVLALSAKAFGPEKVAGIMLPEQDSSGDSRNLAQELADKFNNYKFADYKEHVISLIQKIITVSIKTVDIMKAMKDWHKEN